MPGYQAKMNPTFVGEGKYNMSKVFEFESSEAAAVAVEQTAEFDQTAKELGDLVQNLHLDQVTNDRLLDLMVLQVQQAWKEGFTHGFRIGKERALWEVANAGEAQHGIGLLS